MPVYRDTESTPETVTLPSRHVDIVDMARNVSQLAYRASCVCLNGQRGQHPVEKIMNNVISSLIRIVMSADCDEHNHEMVKLEVPWFRMLEKHVDLLDENAPRYEDADLTKAEELLGKDYADRYGFRFYYLFNFILNQRPWERYVFTEGDGQFYTLSRSCPELPITKTLPKHI